MCLALLNTFLTHRKTVNSPFKAVINLLDPSYHEKIWLWGGCRELIIMEKVGWGLGWQENLIIGFCCWLMCDEASHHKCTMPLEGDWLSGLFMELLQYFHQKTKVECTISKACLEECQHQWGHYIHAQEPIHVYTGCVTENWIIQKHKHKQHKLLFVTINKQRANYPEN